MPLNLKNSKQLVAWLTVFLVGSVCLFHAYFVWNYTLDFPFQDDTLLIEFIGIITNTKLSFLQFLKELFKVANDHRLVIPRLIALIDYGINGQLNFKTYIIIANINLGLIFLFLYKQFQKKNLPIVYFLPVPFLFFQPQMYEVSFWALNGMQHTFVVTFFVLIVTLLETKKKALFYLAIFIAFCGTFTHGNGILAFPAAFFMLLVQQRYKEIAIWIVGMGTCLFLYLLGYKSGQAANPTLDFLKIIESFCGFIGANMMVFFHGNTTYAVAFGALIAVLMGIVIILKIKEGLVDSDKRRIDDNLGLLTLFCLIICTAGVISVVRSWHGIVISSRFALYAALSSSIIYLVLVDYLKGINRQLMAVGSTIFAFIFWFSSYSLYTPIVDNRYYGYRVDEYNWVRNHTMLCVSDGFINNASPFMTAAYKQGIWGLSSYWNQPAIVSALGKYELDSTVKFTKTVSIEEEKYPNISFFRNIIELRCDDIAFQKKTPQDAIYIVLTKEKTAKRYLLATTPLSNAKRQILTDFSLLSKSFTVFIRTPSYDKGRYQVGYLIHRSDGTCSYHLTTASLDI